ncbi:hypothetical protein DFP72DRAFT_915693 [Ephemerocybe angulata]|uniref:Uncharacterized protein n=1 Tax=Ephemerocybe angulata TaxID=980116 RepID=A0A8H6LZF2_9AGAR|nr:hypothetical protein DFP72DRAFT_915693 [Tulosesus angulatus]
MLTTSLLRVTNARQNSAIRRHSCIVHRQCSGTRRTELEREAASRLRRRISKPRHARVRPASYSRCAGWTAAIHLSQHHHFPNPQSPLPLAKPCALLPCRHRAHSKSALALRVFSAPSLVGGGFTGILRWVVGKAVVRWDGVEGSCAMTRRTTQHCPMPSSLPGCRPSPLRDDAMRALAVVGAARVACRGSG